MTKDLLNSQLRVRRELLERSKEVVQVTKVNERLQQETLELSSDLKRYKTKNCQLLRKLHFMRKKTENISKKHSKNIPNKCWAGPSRIFKIILFIIVVIVVSALIGT